MDNTDKLNLSKMINQGDVEETTDKIRELKHSTRIHEDIVKLTELKAKYSRLEKTNKGQFDDMCVSKCSFLFNNYTDIFNKVKKGIIDLNMLTKFLNILKSIEDGHLDQHEASFEVGKILKEIYIDSAIKSAERNDKKEENKFRKHKKISWSEYKQKNMN